MNKPSRLISAAILFLDCSRLLFLITMITAYIKPVELLKGGNFPFVLYAAPNALFPLISLFVFIHPNAPENYKPLYITGKSLSVFCTVLWFFELISFPMLNFLTWPAFIGIADISTIIGMFVSGVNVDISDKKEAINEGGE